MSESKPKIPGFGIVVSYNEQTDEYSIVKARFEGRQCKSFTTVARNLTRYDIQMAYNKHVKELFHDFTIDKLQ